MVLLHNILNSFLFLVSVCRQKEKEQMEMLKKHHEEEIDHHRKEIERLQKEIDRHRGKIRKLKHDDWSLLSIFQRVHPFYYPSQRLPAIDWLYCRSEPDHKWPNDKNLKIKCFFSENACHSLTNDCVQWSVFCIYIGLLYYIQKSWWWRTKCYLKASWIKEID